MEYGQGAIFNGERTGVAELLLGLLVSSLLLCQNGASGRTCVPGSKCHLMLQELYQNAVYLSHSMYFYALDLFFQLTDVYLHRPGYFSAAKKLCHTADILTPDERQDAKQLSKEDIMKVVFHLVDSWNETLQELLREQNHPPKFHRILSTKDQKIYLKYQELKRAIVQIALQLDLEVSEEDFSLNSEIENLKSSNEKQRLFTVYNLLRCFVADAEKIKFLLSFLKCQAANKDNC
ncbi:Prolactin [Fukomys damarensis]|uniref:Prolactin n=1 Tax=Fukomys damarensis TaxID=885580 RepID=A0A091DD98_FUKDA|nr:Prolactin [Fukomys damarensis]